VRGRTPTRVWDAELEVPVLDPGKGSATVVTLYGREAVEDLELRAACGESAVDREIERLGLAFQIVTRLTSWVAVGEGPAVDPTQPRRRERMPHALPAGMSVEGLGLRAAAGSLDVAFCLRSSAIASPRASARQDVMHLQRRIVADSSDDVILHLAQGLAQQPTSLAGRLVRRRAVSWSARSSWLVLSTGHQRVPRSSGTTGPGARPPSSSQGRRGPGQSPAVS
jgi:hypothetical protein